jgi:tol-pal system protein YbgF
MRKLIYSLVVTVVTALSGMAIGASAPVDDLSSSRQSVASASAYPATPAATASTGAGDLYYQVQLLQDEVRELRGIIDEQANLLRQLRQQQLDDYQDLDRRLGGVASPGSETAAPAAITTATSRTDVPLTTQPDTTTQVVDDPEAERRSYEAAYDLLKNRNIDEAITAFSDHVARFPAGTYAANAYYWLGEIYLLQNNLPEANKAFSTVVDNFPGHRKATDAMFKLGKVLHLQGDNIKAQALLQDVAATNSTAAGLAKSYLQQNF